jgi:hypothetical protein
MTMTTPDTQKPDVRELVIAAYEAARQAGKPDWQRMTSAVLKNRLLQLTNGAFRETDYGAESFSGFLQLLADLLDIDKSAFPPLVTLKQIPDAAAPAATVGRIRPDLWYSVMDYSGGSTYVWDESARRARKGDKEEGHVLPTMAKEDLSEWRRSFAASVQADLPEEEDQLHRWADEGLTTRELPSHLQPQWNSFMKARVVERLRRWFATEGLTPPPDLVIRGERQDLQAAETAALRRAVIDAVNSMTLPELRALPIPARLLLRRRGTSR